MSGKGALLDTNVVIELLSGKEEVLDRLSEYDELLLSMVVVGELYYGAENSGRKTHHLQLIDAFLEQCTLLPVDQKVSERYASLKMSLKRKGKPIPENDIWIAATALAHDLELLSSDAHFQELDIRVKPPE